MTAQTALILASLMPYLRSKALPRRLYHYLSSKHRRKGPKLLGWVNDHQKDAHGAFLARQQLVRTEDRQQTGARKLFVRTEAQKQLARSEAQKQLARSEAQPFGDGKRVQQSTPVVGMNSFVGIPVAFAHQVYAPKSVFHHGFPIVHPTPIQVVEDPLVLSASPCSP